MWPMPNSQGPPAPPPGHSRTARRLGCLALLLLPFLLLAAVVKAPTWIDDYRLARMMDRIEKHPRPPGTDFEYFDRHVDVRGDSGDCWYTMRFEISTDRPIREVLNYYRQAKIEDPDGHLGDYDVYAYTFFDEPGTSEGGISDTEPVIIHLAGEFSGSLLNMRCY